ncbi:MAG: macrolide 2'-phosphotransferase [Microbacteriaceae bacterium]|nr:MAG: macrolide 2'-phosphotransferase [Microbacteriaceae bacterium]
MARSHLTLAALATSAVAGLDVAGTRSYSYGGHGDYDAALLNGRDGRQLIIRVPTSQAAETEQSTDLVALSALTAGIRGRLPFDVPTFAGQAPVGGTRAVVYDFLPGGKVAVEDIQAGDDGLAGSIGRAIAAIHSLPTGFVGEAGLPVLASADSHSSALAVIESAAATGLLPAALRDRWREAASDNAVWQFQPVVINGALSADSLLIADEAVAGVLGWSALSVGDPARDLHWLLGMRGDAAESALGAYGAARQVTTDRQFIRRAMLYAELELARWLLHGRELHDQSIVDDAVAMLASLADTVHSDSAAPLSPETGPIMAVTDVEAMLAATPIDHDDDYAVGLEPVDDREGDRPAPDED